MRPHQALRNSNRLHFVQVTRRCAANSGGCCTVIELTKGGAEERNKKEKNTRALRVR